MEMGFVRLLFIVILTCLIIDKVEAPKGRQKARGSQQPKLAVENSVASDGELPFFLELIYNKHMITFMAIFVNFSL
jgi:hypothetical protein